MTAIADFNYVPSPTGLKFHESDAFVKLVDGPFGSGKTCMIMNDAKYYCLSQAPASDGVRYTRIGVVRGTYPELTSTTRNSILEVFPEKFGTVRSAGSPILGHYRFPVGDGPYDYLAEGRPWHEGDGTIADVEFALQALQTAQDAEKIKSANWTFAIINEATSVDYEVFTAILGRIGRYPTENMGGCTYAGVLIDTNQPPQGHWLLALYHNTPSNYMILHQPPAAFKHIDDQGNITYEVNTEAENLRNLGAKKKPDDFITWPKEEQEKFLHAKGIDYYRNQIEAYKLRSRTDLIDSLFCMLDVPLKDGKPVFPLFSMDSHVSRSPIGVTPYKTVIVGYDTSGIHPAAVFMQEQGSQWVILDELYGEDMGMEAFIEQAFLKLVAEKYSTNTIIISCDPANARDSYTGLSPSQHLQEHGFQVTLPKTNDPKTRLRAVDILLNKRAGGLLISCNCDLLVKAMQGGYRYKKLNLYGSVEEAYDPKPEKNKYSHVADALQYACLCVQRDDFMTYDARPAIQQVTRRRGVLRRIM